MSALAEALQRAFEKKIPAGQGGDSNLGNRQMLSQENVKIVEPAVKARATASPLQYVIRAGLMTFDPALAERAIKEAPYRGQRHVNEKHVAMLAELMRRDAFTPGTQIHFGQLEADGSLHLLNGQHRIHGVVAAQAAIQFQVLISPAIDERELATLYWRHDRAARLRSASDVLDAAGISEQFGLKKQAARAIYTAVGVIIAGFSKADSLGNPFLTRSDEARLDAAAVYWPIGARFQALIDPAPSAVKRGLFNAGVTAVALLTLRHQRDRAEEFWSGVAENDGLAKGDPRHTLLRDLSNRRLGSATEWAKVAAGAWNAFYRNEKISFLRITEGQPVISGTSYTAHRRRAKLAQD